jgi:hypothetical protein
LILSLCPRSMSLRARQICEAFVEAGVPHVVCCQRENAFWDPIAIEFIQCFYLEAPQRHNLSDALYTAVALVASTLVSRDCRQVKSRFQLVAKQAK